MEDSNNNTWNIKRKEKVNNTKCYTNGYGTKESVTECKIVVCGEMLKYVENVVI